MAAQYSTSYRNAAAGAFETTVGASGIMRLFTGAPPANCAAANSGTELAEITLPSDWLGSASGGAVAKSGTWQTTADAAGTAGHFRIYASDGTTCHAQGTVTATGGGGDVTVDNPVLAENQTVTVTAFTVTVGGA